MGRELQAVNHSNQVAVWSERVEACRSSGLTVSQWCETHGVAISTYYAWQHKLFQTLQEPESICFAEVPISTQTSQQITATIHGNGLRVELHNGVSTALILSLVEALKSC